MLKTGMTQKEILELMDKETYFNAKTALDNKFVDEIMFDDELKLSADTGNALISEKAIEEMRSYLAKQKESLNLPSYRKWSRSIGTHYLFQKLTPSTEFFPLKLIQKRATILTGLSQMKFTL
jgi:hypothetical protein